MSEGAGQDEIVQLTTTATQRTYRYVRLSIVGAVLLLAVSLVIVFATVGPIASISHAIYTPGRSIFVGVLFGVALALVALSGHSVEQALLDIAALCAPVIAIVPTPLRTGDVPGLIADCPDPATPCVPVAEVPGIQNGMISLVVLAACGIVAAIVIARAQRTLSAGTAWSIGVAVALVIAAAVWGLAAPGSFLMFGHLVATSTFFGIIVVVAAIGAFTSLPPWRTWYAIIAIAIAIDLVFLVTVVVLRLNGVDLVERTGVPFIFIGETIAVALFAVFWTLQTVQLWNDVDPSLIGRMPEPAANG